MSFRFAFAIATAAVLPFLAALPAAHAESVRVAVDGIGASTCGEFLSDVKAQPAEVSNAVAGWALGYMTRRNFERAKAGETQVDFASAKLTGSQVLGYVGLVCEKQADLRIFQVVDAVYEVLLEKGSLTS